MNNWYKILRLIHDEIRCLRKGHTKRAKRDAGWPGMQYKVAFRKHDFSFSERALAQLSSVLTCAARDASLLCATRETSS